MSDPETFPVLYGAGCEKPKNHPTWPLSVPFGFIAEHAQQCRRNHSQTPQRLAERGGLALKEMIAVIHNMPYERVPRMTDDEMAGLIRAFVADWKRNHVPGPPQPPRTNEHAVA